MNPVALGAFLASLLTWVLTRKSQKQLPVRDT
jgi:hypothetical protein